MLGVGVMFPHQSNAPEQQRRVHVLLKTHPDWLWDDEQKNLVWNVSSFVSENLQNVSVWKNECHKKKTLAGVDVRDIRNRCQNREAEERGKMHHLRFGFLQFRVICQMVLKPQHLHADRVSEESSLP